MIYMFVCNAWSKFNVGNITVMNESINECINDEGMNHEMNDLIVD